METKQLIAATGAAETLLADAAPDRNRPLIHRATNSAWWLLSRDADGGIFARDIAGYVVKFPQGQLEEPKYVPPMPPVVLASGKLIETIRHPNGLSIAVGRMSATQWKEYCMLLDQWSNKA